MDAQPDLFDLPLATGVRVQLPPGLRHQPELIGPVEEAALVRHIEALPLKPFEFHGHIGHRRVTSFGWRYDFARKALEPAEPIPAFLLPLREAVAAFAGCAPEAFEQALVLEYTPGAGIGWHRDRPEFGDVAGVSLVGSCPFRLRLRTADGWRRATLQLAPRSAYLIGGPARADWEHSIAPVQSLRYSVTFRTLRARSS